MLAGRTIHAFHIEGCGGGHAPDVLRLLGEPNIIGSSTNPTIPFGVHAVAEHVPMIGRCTRCGPSSRTTWRSASTACGPRRWAPRTCCTTSGVIAITSSDSQGMGRVGRDRPAHVPARRRRCGDERGADGRATTTSACCATWPSAPSTPRSPTAWRTRSARSTPGRLADVVLWRPGVVRRQARAGAQERASPPGARPATRTPWSTTASRRCSARSSAATAPRRPSSPWSSSPAPRWTAAARRGCRRASGARRSPNTRAHRGRRHGAQRPARRRARRPGDARGHARRRAGALRARRDGAALRALPAGMTPPLAVCAPDKLRGALDAPGAAAALAAGARAAGWDAAEHPLADGGEGTLDVLLRGPGRRAHRGRGRRRAGATARRGDRAPVGRHRGRGDRLGDRPRRSSPRRSATRCGPRAPARRRWCGQRSTRARGGSCCASAAARAWTAGSACWRGSARASATATGTRSPAPAPTSTASRCWSARASTSACAAVELIVAADVTSPLTGPEGAAPVFGPQKGATPEMVERLDAGLARLAPLLGAAAEVEGAGAAGGLGAACAWLGAAVVPGAGLVIAETGPAGAARRRRPVPDRGGPDRRLDPRGQDGRARRGGARSRRACRASRSAARSARATTACTVLAPARCWRRRPGRARCARRSTARRTELARVARAACGLAGQSPV